MQIRKYQYRLLVMLFIIAVTVTGLAVKGHDVSAQTSTARGITRDFVNLRSGPGLSFPTLVIIPPERTVDIVGRNAEGNWLQVTVDGQNGWIFRSYISLTSGSIAALPVTSGETTPPPTTGTGTSTTTATTTTATTGQPAAAGSSTGVTTTFVNLRNAASSTAAVIAVIDPNTNVEILGRSGNNRWLKVSVNGQEGWMFKSLVRFNSTILSSLPVLSGTSATTATTAGTGTTGTGSTGTTSTTTTGVTTYPFGVGGPPGYTGTDDGRINPYLYGTDAIIYCRDFNGHTTSRTYQGGGIMVYLYQGPVVGVVFYATEAQINAAGIPATNTTLIRAESGFSLYRLSDGSFQMIGPNRNGSSFNISWQYCFSTSEGE
ncbi:MAG: SH3 domain-containing protein [Chloroflexi bacterium]|nr:SH3 domain-containing protein [Chloroflexota bacterium]